MRSTWHSLLVTGNLRVKYLSSPASRSSRCQPPGSIWGPLYHPAQVCRKLGNRKATARVCRNRSALENNLRASCSGRVGVSSVILVTKWCCIRLLTTGTGYAGISRSALFITMIHSSYVWAPSAGTSCGWGKTIRCFIWRAVLCITARYGHKCLD